MSESNQVKFSEDDRPKGSRRAAGAVPGAILGLIIGGILSAATNSIVWVALFSVVGVLLGTTMARFVVPKT